MQDSKIQFFSVNKLVDAVKSHYPGVSTLSVIINSRYIKQAKSKFESMYTTPLAFIIDKKRFSNDALSAMLDVDKILFNINDKHCMYFNAHPKSTFWAIVIKCTEQKLLDAYKYYNSSVQVINDQDFIDKIAPLKEFNVDELEDDDDEVISGI